MMHIFWEPWTEADIHLNHIVKNQTDFHKKIYFLVDIQLLNWTKFSQKYSHKSYNRKPDWFSQRKLFFCKYSTIELKKFSQKYSYESYRRKLDWFSRSRLFSCRYSNIELHKIFSKFFPRISNKETGL